MAIGSAFEIETQLTIALRRGYITPKAYDDALSDISILEKQLNQFIGKLKGQG
jgi:four helix bundle protein